MGTQEENIIKSDIPMYYRLGATLYVPATRDDLTQIVVGEKLATVRSIVLCTEDAVREDDLPQCYRNISAALCQSLRENLLLFIRPRSPQVLEQLLQIPGISNISGFVLPKISFKNITTYRAILSRYPQFGIMPTLETEIAFCRDKIRQFGRDLGGFSNQLVCVRIGGNDLMGLLGIRHPEHYTIYDTPIRSVIDDIILALRPNGINVSAPVFDYIDKPDLLAQEVSFDQARGFMAKTAIHPSQISIIEDGLRGCDEHRKVALKVLDKESAAVFQMHGGMCESTTHREWAQRIMFAEGSR